MKKSSKWGRRLYARIGAAIISAAFITSSVSEIIPGGVAYAEDNVPEDVTIVPENPSNDSENAVEMSADSADSSGITVETPEKISEETPIGIGGTTEESATNDLSSDQSESVSEDVTVPENVNDAVNEADTGADIIVENITQDGSGVTSLDEKKALSEVDTSEGLSTLFDWRLPVLLGSRPFNDRYTDVWDFSGIDSGRPQSNFRTDEDTINSLYPGIDPGTKGVYLPSFSLDEGDFEFYNGGNQAKLISSNYELTRFANGRFMYYSGYISCDNTTGDDPYIAINCRKDDLVSMVIVHEPEREYPDVRVAKISESDNAQIGINASERFVSFYAPEAGRYKIYSGNGYFGLAQIEREPIKQVTVSGEVKGYSGTENFNIIFTARDRDYQEIVPVIDGKYSAQLYIYDGKWGFDISVDLPGYSVINDYDVFAKSRQFNINIEGKVLNSVKGKVIGIPAEFIKVFADNGSLVALERHDKNGDFYHEAVLQSDGSFEMAGIPIEPGEYDMIFKSPAGRVYTRIKRVVDLSSSSFDIDATYGDYKEKDPGVSVNFGFEGATAQDLKDARFIFSPAEQKGGKAVVNKYKSSEYTYYELATGVIRLPRYLCYKVNVTGLPKGMVLDDKQTKNFNLIDANFIDGRFYATIVFRRINESDGVLNLKAFGAKGDGVTDDTQAVKDAVEAANGKKLYVPEGKYCVSALELSGITVEMFSDADAWFCKNNKEISPMFVFNDCNQAVFTGIGFNGGEEAFKASVEAAGLYFNNSKNITVSGCRFTNFAAKTIAFFGNTENINVSANGFIKASGVLFISEGKAKNVHFEYNFAYEGTNDGVIISERLSAADSSEIFIRGNEFHNFLKGSAIKLRGVSRVRIENNYIDGAKYFIMAPRPYNKKYTDPQLIEVTVCGNHGDASNFAYMYSVDNNANKLYSNLNFTDNAFKLKSGMTMNSSDTVVFKGNHFNMPGSASISFTNSNNISLENFRFDTMKSRKKIFRFDACDEVVLKRIDYNADRDLMQIVNSENANIQLEK